MLIINPSRSCIHLGLLVCLSVNIIAVTASDWFLWVFPSVRTLNESTVLSDRARVVYSYTAENPDELSLQIGDVINVMETSLEDVGWWKGELNGKIGVFPDNFVTLVPLPEVRTILTSARHILWFLSLLIMWNPFYFGNSRVASSFSAMTFCSQRKKAPSN